MTLIKTHDGLIGLELNGKMVWCDDAAHALRTAFAHLNRLDPELIPMAELAYEFDYAFEVLAKMGHTIAEFGVLGGFMYTTAEEESEREF